MKRFVCRTLRMLNYLTDAGFTPYAIERDMHNPRYKVFLFDETPELEVAVIRYFSTDCFSAKQKHQKEIETYVSIKEEK